MEKANIEANLTAIFSAGDQIVYLRDVTTVEYDYEDPRWIARFNGQKAI